MISSILADALQVKVLMQYRSEPADQGESEMKNEPESSSSPNGEKFGKAIVMGASIAGLWTARALIDHFEEVLVLERDHLPEGPEFRSGAPQVRQFHTLLQSGLQQM